MPLGTSTLGGLPLATVTLDHGMRVVACHTSAAPVVAVQIWVGVGSADETPAQAGLAHVHEHMLFKGTVEGGPRHPGKMRRGVGEIAATIERAGGEINAWTSFDQTVYHVVVPKALFTTGVDVLADALQRSAFDRDELGRELEVILEEIKRSEDQPTTKLSRALFETAFQAHPYRRPVIGFADVVKAFTRDDVLHFFDAHYRAERMTAVVVGDVDPELAVRTVRAAFADAPRGAPPLPPRAVEPPQRELRVRGLCDDVQESHLALGFPGPRLLDDDMAAIDVLCVLLGQGESSRLVARVKREQQLVNEAYAYSYTPQDPGLVVVGASLHHDKLAPALAALGAELCRARESRPRSAELDKAKAILASEAIYQRETVEGLARRLGTWAVLTGDAGYEAAYQAKVAGVSAEAVRAAAERLFVPERATLAALAPNGHESAVAVERLAELTSAALTPRAARRARVGAAEVVRVELPSGVRVVVERDQANPVVNVRLAWLGGLRGEPAGVAGAMQMCANLISKGTARTSGPAIAETVDAMAGHIGGFAGRNSFGVRGTFLKEHTERGLALLFECVRDAAFADDELAHQRALTLEELRTRTDSPASMAFDLFGRALWLEHPYRRDLNGTADSVRALSSEGLRAFWRARATPKGAAVVFVGDIDPDDAVDLVDDLWGQGNGSASALELAPREGPPTGARVARLTRERAQAHLLTGTRGLTLDDPDRFALEVLCSVLSGQGGRLFLELRDRQSLCYSVSASAVDGLDPGSFSVYMGTSPDKVDRAIAGIEQLLADVSDRGVTPEELERAARYLAGAHDIGMQRLGARGTSMALNEIYGLGYLAHREVPARIAAVTLADVRRVAARVLSGARVTAIVGPTGTGGPAATLDPPA
ncbi:MAG: insulinase family protein [Deltaproteobacteria bacterium]|nr:insulinase family protein [Deltaproteobacteria bacterium]